MPIQGVCIPKICTRTEKSARESVDAEGGYMDADAVRLREQHRRWQELMMFRKERFAFDEHVEAEGKKARGAATSQRLPSHRQDRS